MKMFKENYEKNIQILYAKRIPAKYYIKIKLIEKLLASNMSKERKTEYYFLRKNGKIYIEEYKIKGFLKEIVNKFIQNENLYQKIIYNIFVSQVKINKINSDGKLKRSLISNQNDKIKTIISSEYLNPGTEIEIFLEVIPYNSLSEEEIKELFKFGKYYGIGQWRKSGFGRFELVDFKKLE